MIWQNKIEEYLKDLLGQDLAVKPVHKKEMHGLPLYLTKAYAPYELVLFEKRIVVLQTKTEANESPGRIAKDLSKIRKHFDRDVAIVFENLASWERKRLIEKQVPFIVPGLQLYLPMLFMDLREYFPRRVASSQEYLSRPTQYALLREVPNQARKAKIKRATLFQ